MSKAIPAAGTYPGKTSAKMVVYEAKTGSLCLAVPVALVGSDPAWAGKTTITLVSKDGTINAKAIENLKKCFGWDGLDFFALEEIEPGAHDLEIVGEHDDTYIPDGETEAVLQFKIKWLNPPGGGMQMQEPMDDSARKSVLTRFSSKLKALAGGAKPTVKAATDPSVKSAPAKAAPSGPPGRRSTSAQARTSTAEEVWAALKKANPKDSDDALAAKYYGAQDEVAPGSNGELTASQWGAVADNLGV